MKKIIFLILFTFFINYFASPIKLLFKYDPNIFLILTTNIEFIHYLNGNFLGESNSLEVTSLDTKLVKNNKAEINSKTYIMEERKILNEKLLRVSEKLKYKFEKDSNGKTYGVVFKKGFHDFPLFPDYELKIGDTWELPSHYVVSLLSKSPSISLDVNVQYQFLGIEKRDNLELALISANAIIIQNRDMKLLHDYKLLKVAGFNNFLIKFDIQNGKLFSIKETFDYYYIMDDYTIIETVGKSSTIYQVSMLFSKIDKEELEAKIKEEKDIKDVNVEIKEDKTLSITLEKIQFYPDNTKLLDGEYNRLDKLAKIIAEKYKSNRMIIVGHTADIGNKKNQKLLSEQRAKVILEYFVNNYNFNNDLISYEGRGEEEPIGDNNKEEGRAKNRRVEIIIITKSTD